LLGLECCGRSFYYRNHPCQCCRNRRYLKYYGRSSRFLPRPRYLNRCCLKRYGGCCDRHLPYQHCPKCYGRCCYGRLPRHLYENRYCRAPPWPRPRTRHKKRCSDSTKSISFRFGQNGSDVGVSGSQKNLVERVVNASRWLLVVVRIETDFYMMISTICFKLAGKVRRS
jgi:hypothetical protein